MSFRLKGWWREGWDSDVKRLGMLVAGCLSTSGTR